MYCNIKKIYFKGERNLHKLDFIRFVFKNTKYIFTNSFNHIFSFKVLPKLTKYPNTRNQLLS